MENEYLMEHKHLMEQEEAALARLQKLRDEMLNEEGSIKSGYSHVPIINAEQEYLKLKKLREQQGK